MHKGTTATTRIRTIAERGTGWRDRREDKRKAYKTGTRIYSVARRDY